jgi:predicted dienelactone hydrolase
MAAGTLVVVSVVVFLWVERRTELVLPEPSGPFAVSRTMETWTDAERADPLGASPADRTELVVWIWYPSTKSPGQQAAEYLPADWRRALAQHLSGPPALLTRNPAAIRCHSTVDGPLADNLPRYPIVLLRGGLGAFTTDYTTLAEDLASHGYVVVGFDAPYRTFLVVFPDGRVVTRPANLNPETLGGEAKVHLANRLLGAWVADMGFVVDRLARMNALASGRFGGRLDMERIAVVGHSLGGATAAQFCHDDPRARVGVDIDGRLFGSVVRDGINRPFMFLLSDHAKVPDPGDRQVLDEIDSVYDRLPAQSRCELLVRGANHFSFSDMLLERSLLVRAVMRMTGVLGLGPRRGLEITAASVRRFLDVQLKEAPAASLQDLSTDYPELQSLHSDGFAAGMHER